jgi:hypothetical protein
LKLDLSSIDDDTSHRNIRRRSNDSDFDAINRSNLRVGDWETNFTLVESKVTINRTCSSTISFYSSLHIQVTKHRVVIVKAFS